MSDKELTAKERLAIDRAEMPEQDPQARATNFSEVNLGLAEAAAIAEASRCLQCKKRPCVAGCPVALRIPEFLGKIAAGEPISFSDAGDETIELTRDIVRDEDGLYAVRVKGDSMIDALINDGDIVVMKHQQEAGNGEMVAIRLKDRDETTLKRFYREQGNPTMQPLYVHPANVEIQGKVVAVIRQVS